MSADVTLFIVGRIFNRWCVMEEEEGVGRFFLQAGADKHV
jgi:hypothetical protein